jgi:AraC-like DNA-binding protein
MMICSSRTLPGVEVVEWPATPHGAYLDVYAFVSVSSGYVALQYRRAGHLARTGDLVLLEPGRTCVSRVSDPNARSVAALFEPAALESVATHRPIAFEEVVVRGGLAQSYADVTSRLSALPEGHDREPSMLLEPIRRIVAVHGTSYDATRSSGVIEEESPAYTLAAHRAAEYLHAHVADPVSLEVLARVACMSKFHLTRVFHHVYGLPPHAYQLQLRLAFAKRLVRHGLSVATAAHRAGFSGPVHLHRHFRARYGVAPGQYATERRETNLTPETLAELKRLPRRE